MIGSEARGQRAILITQFSQYLEGLDFDSNLSLTSVLRTPFTLTPLTARLGSTLALPVFEPRNFLNVPSGATHLRLVNPVAAISDYAYNQESNTYEPKVSDQNGVTGMAYTDYLDVKNIGEQPKLAGPLPEGAGRITANHAFPNPLPLLLPAHR